MKYRPIAQGQSNLDTWRMGRRAGTTYSSLTPHLHAVDQQVIQTLASTSVDNHSDPNTSLKASGVAHYQLCHHLSIAATHYVSSCGIIYAHSGHVGLDRHA